MWELLGEQELWSNKQTAYQITQAVLAGERPPQVSSISPERMHIIEKAWHQDPQQRPSFSNIHDSLKELTQGPLENLSPIESLRALFNSETNSCSWNKFNSALISIFRVHLGLVDPLKPFVTDPSSPDTVLREIFETFFLWFSPLNVYQHYSKNYELDETAADISYTLPDVATICKLSGFVGFQEATNAQEMLVIFSPKLLIENDFIQSILTFR